MTKTIISDSPESVAVIHDMLIKNKMNVPWEIKQTAQKRGVTKIIETLTGVPYDAEHEKENVQLSILGGEYETIAGKLK